MKNMGTTLNYNQFIINVPQGTDTNLLRNLVKRMGWTMRKAKTENKEVAMPALDRALEDVKNGNVYSFDSVDEMMKYLMSDD